MSEKSQRRFPLGRSFGVMQGRLSRQTEHGYQAFPVFEWENEFTIASSLGLEHIEWVVDPWTLAQNPLVQNPASIGAKVAGSGVAVHSVCADFLMSMPLRLDSQEVWSLYEKTLEGMATVGATHLVIPCVDEASLLLPENFNNLKSDLHRAIQIASEYSVTIALEADLAPRDVVNLLEWANSPSLTINYDSGNSASLGYSFSEEMDLYRDFISIFHLKDRQMGGSSVELGTGAAPVTKILRRIGSDSFSGLVTMQAMRDELGLKMFERQLGTVQGLL